MPRRASAVAKSGCAFTSCSQASYSSPMIAACRPSTTWNPSRRSSLIETVASQVVSATQSTSTIAAVRARAAPGAYARSAALSGSTSSIEMTRVRSLSSRSRRSVVIAAAISSADRGSSGWSWVRVGMRRIEPVSCANVKDASLRSRPPNGVMQHGELARCENGRVKETGDVVVVGATGKLGEQVCHRLRCRGERVRALVRSTSDPAARARLEASGVRCFMGDIERPETLDAVFAGTGVVVSTASAFPMDSRPDCIARVDGEGQLAVVAAAEAAGVERVVFVSFPPASPDHPFQRAKRAVEERLRAAQLQHVILHPQKFMDVWFTKPLGFDPDGTVTLYGGGDAAQAWVAVADVAAVAVQAVRDLRLANQTIPFGGPGTYTQREVVALYERLLGRAI